jgi:hypothetical protein
VLRQLAPAARQVRDLGGVAGQLDGLVVRRARLLAPAESAQQVGAGRMERVVAGQDAQAGLVAVVTAPRADGGALLIPVPQTVA